MFSFGLFGLTEKHAICIRFHFNHTNDQATPTDLKAVHKEKYIRRRERRRKRRDIEAIFDLANIWKKVTQFSRLYASSFTKIILFLLQCRSHWFFFFFFFSIRFWFVYAVDFFILAMPSAGRMDWMTEANENVKKVCENHNNQDVERVRKIVSWCNAVRKLNYGFNVGGYQQELVWRWKH